MNDSPTKQVVCQRVRNRIIELLELFSDNSNYEIAICNLEFWADWVDFNRADLFTLPVFSENELAEIHRVSRVWKNVELDSKINSKEWANLVQASKNALNVFMRRGKLSEDIEII